MGHSLAAQVRLVCSADQAAYQVCSSSSVQARLYFVWRGASREARTRRPQLSYGDTARDYLCTQPFRGVHSGHGVRTGVACSSFVRWLVILIAGSSSEVGARSAPGAEARSMYAQGHTRFGAIVPTPRRSDGKVYRSARRAQGERMHTTHAASYQPVRLGRQAAGGAVRQGRQANEPAGGPAGVRAKDRARRHCVRVRRRASSSV